MSDGENVHGRQRHHIVLTMHTFGSGAFFFGQLSLPKWPGRIVFLFGVSFCWLRLLAMTLGDVAAIRAGRDVLGRPADRGEATTLEPS